MKVRKRATFSRHRLTVSLPVDWGCEVEIRKSRSYKNHSSSGHSNSDNNNNSNTHTKKKNPNMYQVATVYGEPVNLNNNKK